jgi:glycosyltransferase involved in cell wall biosynthesis
MTSSPSISVIIPCRNEEKFIAGCLNSILNQSYPKENLEILVVDGISEDKTREIVKSYSKKYPYIKLLENPKKFTPFALNIGIKQAKGETIIRMDSHAIYEKDYISKSIKYLNEYKADNVGGIRLTRPRDNRIISRAIAISISHPFSAGNAFYRTGSKNPRWVDTVFGGCYKKEVFEKIGLFNEKLLRAQDREFNLRLKKSGGKILLVPEIKCFYYARSKLKDFCKWIFECGVAPFYATRLVKKPVFSWRNFVPMIFILSLITTGIMSFFFITSFWLFLLIIIFYFLCAIYFSIKIMRKEREIKFLFVMPFIFLTTHILYGIGSIYGLLKLPK